MQILNKKHVFLVLSLKIYKKQFEGDYNLLNLLSKQTKTNGHYLFRFACLAQHILDNNNLRQRTNTFFWFIIIMIWDGILILSGQKT